MSERFFEDPILNSPYERPTRHWELDEEGIPTQRIVKRRRKSRLITPIPEPKMQGKEEESQILEFMAREVSGRHQTPHRNRPLCGSIKQEPRRRDIRKPSRPRQVIFWSKKNMSPTADSGRIKAHRTWPLSGTGSQQDPGIRNTRMGPTKSPTQIQNPNRPCRQSENVE